jgi:hypothetical protein
MNTKRKLDAAAIRARVVVVLTVMVIGCTVSSALMDVPYRLLIFTIVLAVILQGFLTFELIRCGRRPSSEA